MRILENTRAPFLPTRKLVWMFLTRKPPKWSKNSGYLGNRGLCVDVFGSAGTDSASFERVDVTRFGRCLGHIRRCPDQHNANLLPVLRHYPCRPCFRKGKRTQRRNRLQLHETADWIIDTHLRELHPLLWLKGAHWLFLESQELTHDQKSRTGGRACPAGHADPSTPC